MLLLNGDRCMEMMNHKFISHYEMKYGTKKGLNGNNEKVGTSAFSSSSPHSAK
jgi:hypothetical protein